MIPGADLGDRGMAAESASGYTLSTSDFVWLLGSLCQAHRIPWDPALALQRFPPPYSVLTLQEAGAQYGFRFGEADACSLEWARASFPLVALHIEGDAARPVLVAKADAGRILCFEPGSHEPHILAAADFAGRFGTSLLLVARDAPAGVEGIPGGTERKPFGFRWFIDEFLKYKPVWRNVLAASLALQVVGVTTPLFTQVVIDKVVVHQTTSTLALIALGLFIFMLFSAGMTWLRQYLVLHTGNRVDAVLGSEVFWHLLRLPMPYFERRPTGTLIARLHAVETIREFLAGAAVSLLLDFPFLVIFLAAMFWYSWQLTLIAVAGLVLIAALSALVTPVLRARLNQQFLLGARNQAFVTEYVAGMETVKALQMEPHLRGRYDELLATYLSAGFATRQVSNTYNVLANALEQVMTLSILCAGAMLVMENAGFTIGMLVAFQMFAGRLSQPMLRLSGLWQEFQQASIAVRRLGDVMDAPPEPGAIQPSRTPGAAGQVRIDELAFRYGPDQPWLFRNLSLALEPGRVTVLTGPSGTGKSTLAKLLLGYYPPLEGAIRIDGRDIGHLSANELRQYFGVVPQETVLFSGSLYENLIAANPHAAFDEVIEACRIAEIHDTIEKLPKGYNTLVGEHGVGLSGGQKQRIAIARALLKRPRILVFDEATASLDTPTAERFAQTVNRLRDSVAMLFITHQVPRGLQVDETVSLGSDWRAEEPSP
jgi:subfamily B ATP-binding cassette protein HlyB/CyaB